MAFLSGVIKFLLGFTLAIGLLFAAGVGVTRYMLNRLATPPERPLFANDPSPAPVAPVEATAMDAEAPANSEAPLVSEPSPSPEPVGTLVRVVQPIGLILRQEPSTTSAQLGGIEYNEQVIVLEDSPDGGWQRVQLGAGGIEGWVRSGNVAPLN